MSKQLIFVIGSPYSGRTTWINNNLYKPEDSVIVDAESYSNLYVRSEKKDSAKLYEDTIDDSRKWCLIQVKEQMELETPPQKIILTLIACRPDRWREFISLAITNQYELVFKFPPNKLLFYTTKHNTSLEQYKFIDTKTISRYPRDKKEITRTNSKGHSETVMIDSFESTLLKYIVTETESAYAFYLSNRHEFGMDKEKLLQKINAHYKVTILGEIKKAEKKIKDIERETEKRARELEKEEKKLAKEEERQLKKEEKIKIEQEREREREQEHEVQYDM